MSSHQQSHFFAGEPSGGASFAGSIRSSAAPGSSSPATDSEARSAADGVQGIVFELVGRDPTEGDAAEGGDEGDEGSGGDDTENSGSWIDSMLGLPPFEGKRYRVVSGGGFALTQGA